MEIGGSLFGPCKEERQVLNTAGKKVGPGLEDTMMDWV